MPTPSNPPTQEAVAQAWAEAMMGGGIPTRSSTVEHRNSTFEVTEHHLKLLRHSHVMWSSIINGELFGAATIDPRRPYGDADVIRSIGKILEWPVWSKGQAFDWEDGEIPDKVYNELEEIHQQTDIALQVVLSTGKFEAGIYYWPQPGAPWYLKKSKAVET